MPVRPPPDGGSTAPHDAADAPAPSIDASLPTRTPPASADERAGFDSSRLYRAIVDSATDYAIIAANLEGRVVQWNTGAQATLGWTAAEMIGRPLALIFTPEDVAAGVPQAEMRKALHTGHALDERWHRRRDGSRFWADGRMMVLRDDGREALGYLKIVRDETVRKLTSTQAESATALRLITDHVDTAIFRIDPVGDILFANPAATRLTAWPVEELIGRALPSILALERPDGMAQFTKDLGYAYEERAMVVTRKGGDIGHVTCSQAPIVVDGRLSGAVVTLQDASRRRRAEEAMRAEVQRHEILAQTQRAVEAAWGDEEAIYGAVLRAVANIIGAADAAVVELVEGTDAVVHRTSNPAHGEVGMRAPLSGSLTGAALALGQSVICRDTEVDPRLDRGRSRRYGVRSMIVVPIPRAARFVGVLKICAVQPDAFAPRDLLAAHILVGHIATAYARIDEASALRRLQTSEERLQLALQASETIGIWDWDVTQDRCYGDPRFARLMGVEAEAAGNGLPIAAFTRHVHPEDFVWIKIAARRAMTESGEFAMEFRVLCGEAVIWLSARGRSFEGGIGVPARFLGAVVDITERKRIETSLREAETNARLAVEAAGLGLWDYDPLHDVMRWDERCKAMFGLERDARPMLETVLTSVHPRSREALRHTVQRVLATPHAAGRTHDFEIVRQDDGTERWIEVSAQPFVTEGALTRIIGTVADITERKRLEAALREDEQRFRALAESIPQLTWMADAAGTFVWFNQRWADYTGQPVDGASAAILEAAVHPDSAPAAIARLGDAFRGKTPWEDTLLMRGADGDYRWFLSRAMPLRLADGSILRWFGTHTDIDSEVRAREAQARFGEDLERQVAARTQELSRANERLLAEMADRQRAEEALRQSQKMEAVGQLTGGIAHDFNNLLTGITGSLDLMQKRIAQGRIGELERYINAASTSASRAAALTHRLLAFARRQPLDAKPVNLNALAASMEDLFRRTLGESIEIEFQLASDLWTTLCDPHQLENALLNLVINARDAMPDGGKLAICTANALVTAEEVRSEPDRREGDFVVLKVSDTGTGMTPEVMARIFEPFFTTKPLGQGTGLGLSMMYGFARQSEGHVAVASRAGEGTTFALYLPRFKGAEEHAQDEGRDGAAAHGDGETVLVVEDDPVVRALVLDVLAELGYHTLEAHDGLAGLTILQGRDRVDLLVTDVGLPGLNGRQLAEMARASRPQLKVLFITGYAENAVFGHGPADPSVQMITKPFAIDALAARIRAMIADGR